MDILLVEDDKTTQMVYQHYLKKLKYNSVIVENGVEAIESITSAKAQRYCAIILDLGLPDINGETVLSKIRAYEAEQNASTKQIPIIITTAHSDLEQLARCMQKGAQATFLKPLSFKILKALLEQFFN